MSKIILKTFLILILIIVTFLAYLSIIGIETSKFNNQISSQIKSIDEDIDLNLNKIKIRLNPIKLTISANTIGPNLIYKNNDIDIENIKTNISLKSLLGDKFILSNLQISTKSIEINNFLSFLKSFKNTPQLYILEKMVSNGYILVDLDLNFDSKGKIKKDYKIDGFVRNTKINFLKNYEINNFGLVFSIQDEEFRFEDVKLKFNKIPIVSKKILVSKNINDFYVKGEIESRKTEFDKESIKLIKNFFFKKLNISKLNLNSKSEFSFKTNKRLKIEDLKFTSDISLNNLKVLHGFQIEKFFTESKKELEVLDHKMNLNFENGNFSIDGKGKILVQNKEDLVNYSVKLKDNNYKFSSTLELVNNRLLLDFLNYEKNENDKLELKINGSNIKGKTFFESIILEENDNNFEIKNLVLTEDLKIDNFETIKLYYFDQENMKNDLKIDKRKTDYLISGNFFNSSKILDLLTSDDDQNNLKIFKKNFDLVFKINKVYLDKENIVKNLKGKLRYQKNEIIDANLVAYFSDTEKFSLTIKSDNNGKVTTFFLDRAEPIVKRYRFIKGYENGKLDFYSLKKGNLSSSTLKIYDFKLKELPALTKLLTLASLQGIADILSGEGIRFDEFEMNFRNEGDLMTIDEIYAIGPAISILIEGYVEKSKIISLRGTLVPATTINKAIGSIPVLGKILVGQKTGEGVFGVSFKIKGPPDKLETTVNPIKTLTPRFITRTLEKMKKTN